MRIHFAGADGVKQWQELLHAHGVKNRLESYYWLTKMKKPPDNFDIMLMDSGGFTARTRGVQIKVEDYAEFLNKFEIPFGFELDTNDVKETLSNREYLLKNAKSQIIPIYHYSEFERGDKKYLFDMMDNFQYISVGGIVGRGLSEGAASKFFDFFFYHARTDRWKAHGLGVTNTRHLKKYPFFSVDSTSWLGPGRYGNFKCIRDENFAAFLASERDCYLNVAREIKYWLKIEQTMTANWANKGVIW